MEKIPYVHPQILGFNKPEHELKFSLNNSSVNIAPVALPLKEVLLPRQTAVFDPAVTLVGPVVPTVAITSTAALEQFDKLVRVAQYDVVAETEGVVQFVVQGEAFVQTGVLPTKVVKLEFEYQFIVPFIELVTPS